MSIGRKLSVAIVGSAAMLAPVVAAAPAHATVTNGQLVTPVSSYACGHTIKVTGQMGVGPATLYQVSMIYRHCGTGSVKRKSDVVGSVGFDGKCMTIKAGQAMVIDNRWVALARDTYHGVRSC